MVGAGEASLRGVLVKDAAALERAGRVGRVWFDKTGTLTRGQPAVHALVAEPGQDVDAALALAAAAEAGSEHPFARTIVACAKARGLAVPSSDRFAAVAGMGVRATVAGREVSVMRDAAASCVVAVDGEPRLRIELRDEMRPEAPATVSALRAMGLAVGMLSGDRAAEAERIGAACGIAPEEIRAGLLPADKASIARASAGRAAMVGDGVNDAAALAESGLGVAMGGGVSVAGESAAVVLVGGRLEALPGLVRVGRETLRCIRQNLALAFAYNALAMPAAAFALLGSKGPAVAALAMALSDLSVVGNAVRLKWRLSRQRRRAHAATPPSPAA
jgi:Cu+-exporting ATPase